MSGHCLIDRNDPAFPPGDYLAEGVQHLAGGLWTWTVLEKARSNLTPLRTPARRIDVIRREC
jgi:hypothetical protein